MLSLDTNILLYSIDTENARHDPALAFVQSLGEREDVAVSEFSLVELYVLLRNPAVLKNPLDPAQAVATCAEIRRHPRWQILGFPPGESRPFHDAFWPKLSDPGFARRRVYDWRMALTLIRQGVDEFATVNVKDFEGFGFRRVWDPLKK
jgi:toxin-antitoxin system PIN domain toxin